MTKRVSHSKKTKVFSIYQLIFSFFFFFFLMASNFTVVVHSLALIGLIFSNIRQLELHQMNGNSN